MIATEPKLLEDLLEALASSGFPGQSAVISPARGSAGGISRLFQPSEEVSDDCCAKASLTTGFRCPVLYVREGRRAALLNSGFGGRAPRQLSSGSHFALYRFHQPDMDLLRDLLRQHPLIHLDGLFSGVENHKTVRALVDVHFPA